MKKILVIGASGLIASRFVELAKSNFDITGVDEKTLDITNKEAVLKYFENNKFDSVINFAAFTNVDAAEKESGDESGFVWKLNVEGPKNLIEACNTNNIFLVQISTDFVFPGTENFPGPYAEDAELPNNAALMGWYGWTKNRAEYFLRQYSLKFAIVRVAYPFYAADFNGKLDFAKTYLKLFDEGKMYPIFTDQTMSFLNVDFLVEPFTKLLNQETEGIFHIVSSNTATAYDFVSYLLNKARGAENVVQKSSMLEFLNSPRRTPRPRLGGLKTEFTQQKLGIKLATWQEMVDKFVVQL